MVNIRFRTRLFFFFFFCRAKGRESLFPTVYLNSGTTLKCTTDVFQTKLQEHRLSGSCFSTERSGGKMHVSKNECTGDSGDVHGLSILNIEGVFVHVILTACNFPLVCSNAAFRRQK